MTRANELYTQAIRDEVAATEFLRRYQLLEQPVDIAPCSKCESEIAEKRKKIKGESRPVFRCKRKGCQTFRSVRHESIFFYYTDLNNKMNCKLTLYEILELVFYFVKDLSLDLTEEMTGRSRPTICDWFNMCKEVCSSIVSVNRRGQIVETAVNPVERDEARFAGRRKYNRGRLLNRDERAESTDSELSWYRAVFYLFLVSFLSILLFIFIYLFYLFIVFFIYFKLSWAFFK